MTNNAEIRFPGRGCFGMITSRIGNAADYVVPTSQLSRILMNPRRHLPILLVLLAVSAWCADVFPSTVGENLLGKRISLPEASAGHVAVVVIGFTHASNSQVRERSTRLQRELPTYTIAVLEDAPRLVRGMATAGIRSGVPRDQRDHFLIVTRGEKALKDAVGFDRPDDPYVALIDASGAIRWRAHGAVSEDLLKQLQEQAVRLPNSPR